MTLRCPRCALTIRPKMTWLTVEHCPRCLARERLLVSLQKDAPDGRATDADDPRGV